MMYSACDGMTLRNQANYPSVRWHFRNDLEPMKAVFAHPIDRTWANRGTDALDPLDSGGQIRLLGRAHPSGTARIDRCVSWIFRDRL